MCSLQVLCSRPVLDHSKAPAKIRKGNAECGDVYNKCHEDKFPNNAVRQSHMWIQKSIPSCLCWRRMRAFSGHSPPHSSECVLTVSHTAQLSQTHTLFSQRKYSLPHAHKHCHLVYIDSNRHKRSPSIKQQLSPKCPHKKFSIPCHHSHC